MAGRPSEVLSLSDREHPGFRWPAMSAGKSHVWSDAELNEYAAQLVAARPPLTPEQRAAAQRLLAPLFERVIAKKTRRSA